jgi:SAM-dependent methyltransferase
MDTEGKAARLWESSNQMKKCNPTLQECHDYWRNPPPGSGNHVTNYTAAERLRYSRLITNLMALFVDKESTILELGCNSGRNLEALRLLGYTNLNGVEISARALVHMKKTYPNLKANISHNSIERVVNRLKLHDVIFTYAVLEHIHPDSAWVFEVIPQKCRWLLTIEDEGEGSWRQFPRNYGEIFTGFGMRQLFAVRANFFEEIIPEQFIIRLFCHA